MSKLLKRTPAIAFIMTSILAINNIDASAQDDKFSIDNIKMNNNKNVVDLPWLKPKIKIPEPEVVVYFSGIEASFLASKVSEMDAIVQSLLEDAKKEIIIKSFGGGNTKDENKNARSAALKRGIAVREYLTKLGINRTQLDLKILDSKNDSKNPNRIEFYWK